MKFAVDDKGHPRRFGWKGKLFMGFIFLGGAYLLASVAYTTVTLFSYVG